MYELEPDGALQLVRRVGEVGLAVEGVELSHGRRQHGLEEGIEGVAHELEPDGAL